MDDPAILAIATEAASYTPADRYILFELTVQSALSTVYEDDQAAVLNVRDRGLVVLTGCGHAGIVNIVRYARKLTGVEQVYAVIGGFHLNGPLFEPIIPATCEALAGLAPEVIVPAHCTVWRAVHALAASLPEAFHPEQRRHSLRAVGGLELYLLRPGNAQAQRPHDDPQPEEGEGLLFAGDDEQPVAG